MGLPFSKNLYSADKPGANRDWQRAIRRVLVEFLFRKEVQQNLDTRICNYPINQLFGGR
jgi:hypothetical protein